MFVETEVMRLDGVVHSTSMTGWEAAKHGVKPALEMGGYVGNAARNKGERPPPTRRRPRRPAMQPDQARLSSLGTASNTAKGEVTRLQTRGATLGSS
jgi:hypothetical protein